jgi:hypothetical protein
MQILFARGEGVESVPGEGATFWCILPTKIEAGDREVARANLI